MLSNPAIAVALAVILEAKEAEVEDKSPSIPALLAAKEADVSDN